MKRLFGWLWPYKKIYANPENIEIIAQCKKCKRPRAFSIGLDAYKVTIMRCYYCYKEKKDE